MNDPRDTAIEQLRRFGLTDYAARTYVALMSLGTGTARDVSEVSAVPRTRVYDAVDELHERGLVDVQQSTPREFWAISAETACRTFERDFERRIDRFRTAVDELEPVERRAEQRGVWTVDGQPAVTERVTEFVATAEDEVVFMTVETLLTDDVIAALREAAERGVTIKLGGVSPTVGEQLRTEIPGVETFESLWAWSDTAAGRLLLIDRRLTLVSALVNGANANQSAPRSETAIWGDGASNSLVAVLKAIFAWRLGPQEDA